MFRKAQDFQIDLSDRYIFANKQLRNAVDSSRAKLVGDFIYPYIDEEKFSGFFSSKDSRPNIEIRKYVSFLILERMYRLSEADALEFLRSGSINFQYALHTTQYETQPLSESSLRRFRRNLEAYNKEHKCDLLKDEFTRLSKAMAVDMGLLPEDPENEKKTILVRMDSMEIEAHAKVMTRLEILYTTNIILLRYLLKQELDYLIPGPLAHYFEPGDRNNTLYYRASDEEKETIQKTRIQAAVNDMVLLHDMLVLNFMPQFISEQPALSVFERVYSEQVIQDENGARIPRDKHDIPASSVQNPFDETVTYRNKRGPHHGSVLNIAEVHDENGNGIIIHADVEQNIVSDNELEEAFLDALPEDGVPIELQTDGAYGSESLEEKEKEKNVIRKSTSLTGQAPDPVFADFEIGEDGETILSCPLGRKPTSCTYNENTGTITAQMPENCCAGCPHRQECKARVNNKKNKSTVCVKVTTVKRAKHAKALKTQEYQKAAHQRNAVEGIMSVMRRKYDIDHIPAFGLERSKTWIWCSLISYNLVKYQRSLLVRKKSNLAA